MYLFEFRFVFNSNHLVVNGNVVDYVFFFPHFISNVVVVELIVVRSHQAHRIKLQVTSSVANKMNTVYVCLHVIQ